MIFLSYRRSDSEAIVGTICRELRKRFPDHDVFLDHDSIPLGSRFPEEIRRRLRSSRIALVLIGPQWCHVTRDDGQRRLDDPNDYVRLEVEESLRTPGLNVVPLWVMRAKTTDDEISSLPESLQPLFQCNGMQLRPVPDEEDDIRRLIDRLSQMLPSPPRRDAKVETEELLVQAFQSTLTGQETSEELKTVWQVFAATTKQPDAVIQSAWKRVRERYAIDMAKPEPAGPPAPRLLVDLGSNFQVGHAMSVEFHLICPGYDRQPQVKAHLSHGLDRYSHWAREPRLRQEEVGYWWFTEEFALKDPVDLNRPCDPGSYRMDLEITFPAAPVGSPGRFLRTGLRIHVPDPRSSASRTLEIDGDGLSIIDLEHVPSLAEFSRVVIRGSEKSIINLGDPPHPAASTREAAAKRFFQLPIKRNYEGPVGRVFASTVIRRPSEPQSRLALSFAGGARYLVFAKERLQCGRQRSPANDVILRFVPGSNRGDEPQHLRNERLGESISREHFAITLTRDGLAVTDLGSSRGTHYADQPLLSDEPKVIPAAGPSAPEELRLADVFRLLITLFPSQSESLQPPGNEHIDAVGASHPATWRLSGLSHIEAARISRVTNLPAENYVMVFRQALVGFSSQCALSTRYDEGIDTLARVLHLGDQFWIERLVDQRDCAITVDHYIPQNLELVPLCPGQRWMFGQSECVVEDSVQDLTGYPGQ